MIRRSFWPRSSMRLMGLIWVSILALPIASGPTLAMATEAHHGAEREMSLDGLGGLFLDAGEHAPAILIVPGSGPTDRDGNNPMGVAAAPYRLLAQNLQQAGISTLRVDKRGLFSSAAAGDPNAVTLDIYAQDYINWATRLRAETGQGCVYLLGHSEGGQMVSAAAAQNAHGICGLILVSAPGRPLFDVLREQLRANPANAPILDQALGAIDQLEAGNRVEADSLHPALMGLFAPQVQDFIISSYGVDPKALVTQAGVPTLVIQGDRDIQVSVADADRLAEADNAELVLLPGVNHVLKDSPEDRAANLATYADPELPLAVTIVPAIQIFVAQTDPAKP